MIHLILIGLLLGWGAAIPIGPLNLEIVRRNLHFGALSGAALGLGACSGDVTYLILLSAGALAILNHVVLLKVFGVVGALILGWFAYQSLTMQVQNESHSALKKKPLWRHYLEGYALVLVNPYTVLFWLSVSSQIATYASSGVGATMLMGFGVVLGVTSWAIGLNIVLHYTKHKLSAKTMHWFNRIGGVIILGFAVGCLVKVFS
jgi:L-lysine exporter family protein LysE/ArgO